MKSKPILLALAVTLASAFVLPTQVKAQETVEPLVSTYDYVFMVADVLEVDPYVMCSLIEKESTWNPNALSSNGRCYGLCQIDRGWKSKAKEAGFGDFTTDPYANIAYGTYMIKNYLIMYDGDYNKALVHYNAGHLYANSSSYSRSILKHAEELRLQDDVVRKVSEEK